MKRYAIVGATSAIAEHCARIWLTKEDLDLTLVARNKERAESVVQDLRVRSPGSVIRIIEGDLVTPSSIEDIVREICQAGDVDCVLIAHGSLPDQEACQNDLARSANELSVNGISPALFAEAFANKMSISGRGQIGIIGSVAGDRGRKSNYIYGAAKGLLTRYAQGLQHRFAGTDVVITLVKPGPTQTPMTAHLSDEGPKMADVTAVAQTIVNGMAKERPVVYAPGKWLIIMMIIRHLPRFIFNRMDI
ncbi:oxidoreductase, short chain dehydrogenase/reductase family [marine gamma proteobacterium HTCC2148]|nr:oxidoreductase, short chain dehydrogenase/reductase family [marine gamma proteobacterium HTCC2148]